ncbi:hypothetical protein L6V77_01050 [Myxococcota bacterium]|nr:hypothetical protein [Myxococcota bacterium]
MSLAANARRGSVCALSLGLALLPGAIARGADGVSPPAGAPASSAATGAPDGAAPEPGRPAGTGPQTLAEAEAAGFTARPVDEPAGSLLGGLLSVGPGFFVHGVGHFYVDETATAWRLLIGELVGLGLVAGGVAMQAYTDDAGALGALRRLMIHSGVALFVGTWVTDILGTFKGAESFDPDSSRTQGHQLSLAYRYRADDRDPRHHHLVAGLELDFGRVYLRPEGVLDAALDERDWRLDTGVRLWRGENRHNAVALGLRARRTEYVAEGYAIRSGEVYLHGKLDLGQAIRSMRGFYLTHRVGVGLEQYQFATETGRTPTLLAASDFDSPFFSLATGAEVNTGRRTHVGVTFVQDPTAEVTAASADTGVLALSLGHRYRDDLEIQVDVMAGDGWAVWLGLGYGL